MLKQKIAIQILLLVARMLSDEQWRDEIKSIATHISVWVKDEPQPLRGREVSIDELAEHGKLA